MDVVFRTADNDEVAVAFEKAHSYAAMVPVEWRREAAALIALSIITKHALSDFDSDEVIEKIASDGMDPVATAILVSFVTNRIDRRHAAICWAMTAMETSDVAARG